MFLRMKNLILFSFLILAFSNLGFSQIGWNTRNLNSTNNLQSIYFPSGNIGYVVGDAGTLYKTTDGGTNWNQLNTGTTALLMDVYFLNELTGWVVGQNGTILKTEDGGNNWVSISYPTNHILYQSYFFDDDNGWVVGGYGLVLKTTNEGENWTPVSLGTSSTLLGVKFLNSSIGLISGDYGNIFVTFNGGINWTSQWFGISNNLNRMSFVSTSTGWISGTNGVIIKTTNSGLNWVVQNTNTTSWLTSLFFISPNEGWAIGTPATIIKTNNGGNNWFTQYSADNGSYNSCFFLNDKTGFVAGYGGTLLRTTNGGMSVPSMPQLISPPNNALNQSLTPTMSWVNVGGDNYSIQISTTPNFYVISDSATVSVNQYTVPPGKLHPALTYFWRVQATNYLGTGPWSDVWSFGTNLVPDAPVLISPPTGSSNVPLVTDFTWSNVPTANFYHIRIMLNSGFIVDSATVTGTTYTIPPGKLNIGTYYFWRVYAGNINGNGPWSSTFNFSTVAPPIAPVLIYPTNGMIDVNQTPTLDWGDLTNADNYKVQLSTVSDFGIITDSSTVTTSQYTVPAGKLQMYYTYFWRVNATNYLGTGPWSAVWRFTVSISGLINISSNVPSVFKLYSNYPNPFNPVTKIKFDLPQKMQTQLVVYDALGRLVERLVNRELQAGTYEFTWDASKYNSGIYFVRIVSGSNVVTKKMALIK